MNPLSRVSRGLLCVLALCAWSECGAERARAAPRETPPTAGTASGAYADVHGLKMFYESRGDGPVLVLLHGGLASIPVWQEALDFFSQHFRVIAPEQMGHGRTADDPGRPFNYHDMAEDTVELLRQLDVKAARFLGWSDGGIIGLDMAMNHPQLVRSLAISGANLKPPPSAAPRKHMRPEDVPAFLHDAYVRLTPDGADHWPILVSRLEEMWWSQPSFTEADLAKITARTLVIAGDRDFVTPEESVELWRGIPAAELWIVPNGTHGVPKLHASDFNATVLAFFNRASATP